MVASIDNLEAISRAAEQRGWRVERFEHSLNLNNSASDLRIPLQIDPRYQDFIPRATLKEVLGYSMMVASLGDILKVKIWAFQDPARRQSKRLKDLSDIILIVEANPDLASELPLKIREELDQR